MGVEQVDMISELRKRSMDTIVDKILANLDIGDLVRVSSVNREWRQAVRDNKRLNRERHAFVKHMRAEYHVHKENRRSSSTLFTPASGVSVSRLDSSFTATSSLSMTVASSPKPRRSSLLPLAQQDSTVDTSSTFGRSIDLNRLSSLDAHKRTSSATGIGVEMLQAVTSLVSATSNFTVSVFLTRFLNRSTIKSQINLFIRNKTLEL